MTDPRPKWLAMLATLTSPSFPAQATQSLLAFMPLLGDMPEGAFTVRSLHAVAATPRRQAVPSIDELRRALHEWYRDFGQDRTAIAGPADGLDAQDRNWMRYWHTRQAEGFRPYGESPGGADHVGHLVRSYSPRAWAQIRGAA